MKGHLFKFLAVILLGLVHQAAFAGTVTYVYTDLQGTPVMESDAQGHITARFDYTPYGVPAQGLSGSPNGPGYTGHVNDPDTRFVYMQARYYDYEIGRFLVVDPVGPMASNINHFSRYSYGYNNPVNNIDPDGRCPWCVGLIAGAVVEVIAQKIVNPHADINWKSVAVSAVAGAVTGGISSVARAAAVKGTISISTAIAGTAAANAIVSGAASAADSAVNGERPSTAKVLTAAALGGVTSGAVGAAGAKEIFAEKIVSASIGAPAGIGSHIASATNSATARAAGQNAVVTVVSENAQDLLSSVVDKEIDEKIDRHEEVR